MTLPTVAIIGRPNVGKSSLLNALAGERMAMGEVRNPDGLPGLRWEMLAFLAETSPCMGPTRILSGPGPAYAEAMEIAKSEMIKTPGEREFLRVIEETMARRLHGFRTPLWARPIYALSRLSGALLRNERIPGCTALALEILAGDDFF